MAEADPIIAEATQTSLPVRQPALDGVRAVAVIMVLAAHANLFKLGGLGVDIFFGLSGYLITDHLFREMDETGTVSFGAFYARRIRRLLPAAFLVLAVTAVASAVLYWAKA